MSDIVRVLRILEYTGPREWVERTLEQGAVPANGQHTLPNGSVVRSAIIGQYPEILEKAQDV
jgi:hypothetical protein